MIDFPPVRPGEPLAISASSFVAFERCPESAAARYRGEYGPDSKAGFLGQLSHRVFARHLNGGPIAETDFPQACREEIGSALNPKIGSLSLKPSEVASVIEEVGSLYARFKGMAFDGFAGAEVALEAIPADGVTLHGTVDAVFADGEMGTRLVDWKTGHIYDDSTDQLAFYALLWTLEKGELPGRVEAISVRSGERWETVPSLAEVELTAGRVAVMVDVLRDSWARGVEPARSGGPWCRYCPLLDSCTEGQAAAALPS